MAERPMDKCLNLQRCACRYGSGAWLRISAPLRHSIAEGSHCAPGIERKIFGRAFSAAHLGEVFVARASLSVLRA